MALLVSSAWVLPGPLQGSCRGVAVVPGKDLDVGLVGFLGKDLAEDRRLLVRHQVLYASGLHKDLHATTKARTTKKRHICDILGRSKIFSVILTTLL